MRSTLNAKCAYQPFANTQTPYVMKNCVNRIFLSRIDRPTPPLSTLMTATRATNPLRPKDDEPPLTATPALA